MARFVPLDGGDAELDRATGLAWQLVPEASVFTWADAMAPVDGWRLPGIDELMAFLVALAPGDQFAPPQPGTVWWSASQSPFAPAGLARAVEYRAGGSPSVVLRATAADARRWLVRV
jgi:hypothetical protein